MRLSGLAVTIISACVLLLASAGPAAAATEVSCGQLIRSPGLYTLSSDLVCTEGVRIESGDVTIDLQGHTITSPGAFNIFGAGVNGVLIKNGTIKGTATGTGVQVGDRSLVTLRNLTITENDVGVYVWSNGSRARIEDNLISSNRVGVVAIPSGGAEIVNNRIVDNVGGGITGSQAGGYISNNFIARNGIGIATNDAFGVISDNMVVNNRGNGISVAGTGLFTGWVVTGNSVFGNGGYGIRSQFPIFATSSGNRAAGNGSTPQCWNVQCSPSGR